MNRMADHRRDGHDKLSGHVKESQPILSLLVRRQNDLTTDSLSLVFCGQEMP
jgi:hypothetical protein